MTRDVRMWFSYGRRGAHSVQGCADGTEFDAGEEAPAWAAKIFRVDFGEAASVW